MEYVTNAPKGAVFLDDRLPGWADRIDLEGFDITYDDGCILGQLYGGYHAGRYELFSHRADGNSSPSLQEVAAAYGFDVDFDKGHHGDQYKSLQAEWTALINERKTA